MPASIREPLDWSLLPPLPIPGEGNSLLPSHILLVDDDALLRRSLSFNLERAGYDVSTAASAEEALPLSHHARPDLILLDIGLPGMDGLEAIRYFRDRLDVPVIFLTARRSGLEQVRGLEMGADDYITKPFDLDVLLAHVKAFLRRSKHASPIPSNPTSLIIGDLTIDAHAHTVLIGTKFLDLPPREFDLLYTLALEAGHVVSADDILARVWGAEYEGESQVVYVHIRWLRDKIEEDPHHPRRIITIHGVGYNLEPQEI